jgi:MFS family permease
MRVFPGKIQRTKRARLAALCACNTVIYAGISGLVGLMPIYLSQAGADPTQTGLFLAFMYVCLAASTVVGGTLSQRFQRQRAFLIASGALAALFTWTMRNSPSVTASLVLMGGVWFATGIAISMTSVLTGLSSTPGSTGPRFGVLNLSAGLGLLFGSLVSGRVVDHLGFNGLFAAFGSLCLLIPLAGLLVNDRVVRPNPTTAAPTDPDLLSRRTIVLLLFASVLAQAANIMLFLSRALLMHDRGYNATAITTASAVGSVVTLPLPLVLGSLADRVGPRTLMVACFAAPVLGLLVQVSAVELWQFWVASAFSTVVGTSIVVASALVTDMVPRAGLSTPLALLNATPWVGIVIGLSAGGAAIHTFQMTPALMLALVPAGIAIILPLSLSTHKVVQPRGHAACATTGE